MFYSVQFFQYGSSLEDKAAHVVGDKDKDKEEEDQEDRPGGQGGREQGGQGQVGGIIDD